MNLEELTIKELFLIAKTLEHLLDETDCNPTLLPDAIIDLSKRVQQEVLDRHHRDEVEQADFLKDPWYQKDYDQD